MDKKLDEVLADYAQITKEVKDLRRVQSEKRTNMRKERVI